MPFWPMADAARLGGSLAGGGHGENAPAAAFAAAENSTDEAFAHKRRGSKSKGDSNKDKNPEAHKPQRLRQRYGRLARAGARACVCAIIHEGKSSRGREMNALVRIASCTEAALLQPSTLAQGPSPPTRTNTPTPPPPPPPPSPCPSPAAARGVSVPAVRAGQS